MALRVVVALVIGVCWVQSLAAQVVRFETTLGDFDMVLNPTNNPRLQGHVDNLLQYVEEGNYRASWINRADEGFVLQMGGFYSHTRRPPPTVDSVRSVRPFDPVIGAPNIPGLSNTVGTVSLALPGSNVNGGTSSFFINLANNTGLNSQFTVFGAIPDMTVVNQIMALMQTDLTADADFGADPGNLAFVDVPLMGNGHQVFIRRAFVVEDAMTIAQAMSAVAPVMALSSGASGSSGNAPVASSIVVPEPAGFVLAALAMAGLFIDRRRRRV